MRVEKRKLETKYQVESLEFRVSGKVGGIGGEGKGRKGRGMCVCMCVCVYVCMSRRVLNLTWGISRVSQSNVIESIMNRKRLGDVPLVGE